MIARAINYNPAKEAEEKTFLTAPIVAAATSSAVQSNQKFATNDFVLLGEIGNEYSEVIKLSGVTTNQTLNHATVTPKFPHPSQTVVYRLKWDKVEFWRASTKTGSYSLITTVDLDVDNPDGLTVYDDTAAVSTDWGKVRFKNSHTTTYSEYSQPFSYAGASPYQASTIIDNVIDIWNIQDPSGKFYDRRKVLRILNEGVDKSAIKMITFGVTYYDKECTPPIDLVGGTKDYDWLTSYTDVRPILRALHIKYSSGGDFIEADPQTTIPDPTTQFSEIAPRFQQLGGKTRIYPTPTVNVTQGLKVFAPRVYTPIDDETDEPDMPRGTQSVLIPFALMRLSQMKGRGTKALDYQKEWEDAIAEACGVHVQDQTAQPRYVHYVSD